MIIGIDPGASKPHAMAMIHNGHLIHAGPVSPDISIVFDWMNKYNPTLVAIEGQYAGPNIKVLIQLAESRGKLIAACEYSGVNYQIIQPQQWLSSIGLKPNVKRSPERDQWIIKIAKSMITKYAVDNIDVDMAAAINIAFYAFKRWDFKKKVVREKL